MVRTALRFEASDSKVKAQEAVALFDIGWDRMQDFRTFPTRSYCTRLSALMLVDLFTLLLRHRIRYGRGLDNLTGALSISNLARSSN